MQLLQQSEVGSFRESTFLIHQCQQAQFLKEVGGCAEDLTLLHQLYEINTSFKDFRVIRSVIQTASEANCYILTEKELLFQLTSAAQQKSDLLELAASLHTRC